MTYVATFFAHIGAIRFHKLCQEDNIPAKLSPVPRTLSSSCGTCVIYETGGSDAATESDEGAFNRAEPYAAKIPVPKGVDWEEVEQIAFLEGRDYEVIYENE